MQTVVQESSTADARAQLAEFMRGFSVETMPAGDVNIAGHLGVTRPFALIRNQGNEPAHRMVTCRRREFFSIGG